jgi:serine phosphatase RsbU (regulator of sigma subunit)/putative methionine-R-sulfoxide reductase with GAF domain
MAEIVLAQSQLIIETTQQVLDGRAGLWLADWLGQELGCLDGESASLQSRLAELFSERPPGAAAACAWETKRTCFGGSPGPGSSREDAAVCEPILADVHGASCMAAPLFGLAGQNAEAALVGVLSVERLSGPAFESTHIDLLEGLASQAGSALQTGRQIAAERRQLRRFTTISQVSSAITSILDIDELLNTVINLIQERFGFPFVHVFSVHPGRRKIFYEAGSGERSEQLRRKPGGEEEFAYDLDDPAGMIPWVARSGQMRLANDVSKEPYYRPSPLPPQDTQAEMTIPLCFGSQVLGVLDIQSDHLDAFGQDDIFVLEILADTIAIAMRNASLYRSERWRRQVADSLREVAGLLSADVDLDQVLNATLTELERNLPCDLAAIWLLGETVAGEPQRSPPPLQLAAVGGPVAAWLDPQVGLNLDEIFEINSEPNQTSGSLPPGDWLAGALGADQPIVRPATAEQDGLGSSLEFPASYSAIAAPLRTGSETLGVLTLLHHSPGRYGSEARAMTEAFASYAAVAIENTRLYEAAHEQVWVSTVLLQVAEATQSLTELGELLATVVRITPMLVGVNACAIYLLDGDTFIPAAASGLNAQAQLEFSRWRFSPGEVPALDQLLAEKRPTILHRHGEDLRLANSVASGSSGDARYNFLVLAPLMARGEVLGTMLVEYSADPLKSSVEGLEIFFDERLPIIQGIAHQTATAVENIQLLKSQKEDAYVTVALLQVAQAIVSSTDLQETLGAVVRITPILTGVKRSALYLLDHASGSYYLAEDYGLPRDADRSSYTPEEFPLLEAVTQRAALVASSLEVGEDIDLDDVPEAWTHLEVLEPEQVEVLLASEPRLLLAFPLTVKGERLGVLLAEEPVPQQDAELASLNSNLRLRSKRVEITTGISQQAALAVQNDQLLRERVDRERLEREMQLAREIQRTFLPRQVPDLPGWELNVWWRTARETGGDFYDFFALPGNRFGLVIADVADKGMPAALFMTLVRTLVRAAVRELDSPAAVLERVNDLLLPDAEQGLFVTLFYAVLDLSSGELAYANGGHNPPFWVQAYSGEISLLARSGMALGVMEGNQLEERHIQLAGGDYLIFYTDGVTDAFSPLGELFSTERLIQAVREASQAEARSAQAMLQYIDAAVYAFCGDAPQQDDSTVLVVMRRPTV